MIGHPHELEVINRGCVIVGYKGGDCAHDIAKVGKEHDRDVIVKV